MRLVALEKEEVLGLLEVAKRHSPRAHAMVLLAIRHGLRLSEVTGLRVEHVNMKEGWIRVERLKGSLATVARPSASSGGAWPRRLACRRSSGIRTSPSTTTGTLLARAGASAFLIRQHLGHRSISSFQVYCSVSDRDASAAAVWVTISSNTEPRIACAYPGESGALTTVRRKRG